MKSRAWVDDALCARMSADLADLTFFGREHDGGQRHPPEVLARARAICEQCPVLFECLDDVLDVPLAYDRHGVRAGLLPSERADLRPRPPSAKDSHWTGGSAPRAVPA